MQYGTDLKTCNDPQRKRSEKQTEQFLLEGWKSRKKKAPGQHIHSGN